MTDTAAQRQIQKLQRAIVDGLEDVKAQDIQVFNTEAMTPLFERVVIASGTSNRQTKALAASVRDKVAEAGFAKPRVEGEDNGEWIIVDCGSAVVHVMQPAIRQYYRLEEIWGGKPVRLRKAPPPAAARAAASTAEAPRKTPARKTAAAAPAAAPRAAKTVRQTAAARSADSKAIRAPKTSTPRRRRPAADDAA